MDLKEMELLGDSLEDHFYYVSKGKALYSIIKKYRAKTILDIGAGSGLFSKQLLSTGTFRYAVCLDIGYTHEYTEIYKDRPVTFVKSIDDLSQDVVLMMDVLEHVTDDQNFLSHYVSKMKLGTKVLITVPAFQFLWSDHDLFLEHKRRYNTQNLKMLVESSGLRIIKIRYFFAVLFPVVALLRTFKSKSSAPKSELKNYPFILNRILVFIHDIERFILLPINSLAGLTIFCLAEKVK
jgi:hypothetical protein